MLEYSIVERIRSPTLRGDAGFKSSKFRQEIVPLNYVGNYMSGKWEFWSGSTDFCISVLKVSYEPRKWEVIQPLVSECGWIFPFGNIAIVCARPVKFLFDNEERLHAEGEPAVLFADGYSLYFHHGVKPPVSKL